MTDNTSMLERMGDAIADAAAEATLYERGRGLSVEEARQVARAALQAIREPSPEVAAAFESDGLRQCDPAVAEDWRKEYRRIWQAGVAAILSEDPTNG